MASKYENFETYLSNQQKSVNNVSLSFKEIERILGASLPRSAYTHRQWWENPKDLSNRPQAKSWIEAGFKVDSVRQQSDAGLVLFRRI